MNDIEINQAVDLADKLQKTHASKILFCANALNQMRPDRDLSDQEVPLAVQVFARIYAMALLVDEPRFSLHDYVDGVSNARQTVSLEKLLALDEDSFDAAMIWLATDKRETYEDREHAQEPLEIDIYA